LQIGLPAGAALRAAWTRCRPDAVYAATEGPLGWSALRAGAALGVPVYSGFHTNFHTYVGHYRAGWLRHAAAGYLRYFHNASAERSSRPNACTPSSRERASGTSA
jgi:hypothetical protein